MLECGGVRGIGVLRTGLHLGWSASDAACAERRGRPERHRRRAGVDLLWCFDVQAFTGSRPCG